MVKITNLSLVGAKVCTRFLGFWKLNVFFFSFLFFFSAGDIHIWDQESGVLAHHIRGHTHYGDITCIAWNQAAEDPYIFAEGSHDGTVRIWTRASSEDATEHSIARSTGDDPNPPTTNTISNYLSRMPRSSSPEQMEQHASSSSLSLEDHEAFRRTSL